MSHLPHRPFNLFAVHHQLLFPFFSPVVIFAISFRRFQHHFFPDYIATFKLKLLHTLTCVQQGVCEVVYSVMWTVECTLNTQYRCANVEGYLNVNQLYTLQCRHSVIRTLRRHGYCVLPPRGITSTLLYISILLIYLLLLLHVRPIVISFV